MNEKMNFEDINHIIFLIKKMKQEFDESKHFSIHPGGAKYILGQTLRQLIIPDSNIYLTHKADVLWKKIRIKTRDSIFDYAWQQRIFNENDNPIDVLTYKGASKTAVVRTIQTGECFNFRQVFHDEHIIPMKMIIDELVKIEELTYDSVMGVISKISICRMLKSEDRKIRERSRRPFSRNRVIEEIYLGYGIYIKGYDYEHQSQYKKNDFEDSIHLSIPKEIIIQYLQHPEEEGDTIVELPNGMTTDVYHDDKGEVFSITNNNKLIDYVMMLQEVFAKDL